MERKNLCEEMAGCATGRVRRLRAWMAWCAYIALGVYAFVAAMFLHPGIYRGHIVGSVIIGADLINVEAKTQSRWYWVEPCSHAYQVVEVKLVSFRCYNWVATIHLSSHTWRRGDETGPLDTAGLARLLPSDNTFNADRPQDRETIDGLLRMLQSLHDGSFLMPRHHPYHLEGPARPRYQHLTLGMDFGLPLVWLWCTIWPVYLVVRRKKFGRAKVSPLKVYLVTLVGVAALNAVCVAIHAAFSPGSISEMMEFVLALVINFPAYLLLGNYVLHPIGFVTGAVLWATVFSIIAALQHIRRGGPLQNLTTV